MKLRKSKPGVFKLLGRINRLTTKVTDDSLPEDVVRLTMAVKRKNGKADEDNSFEFIMDYESSLNLIGCDIEITCAPVKDGRPLPWIYKGEEAEDV